MDCLSEFSTETEIDWNALSIKMNLSPDSCKLFYSKYIKTKVDFDEIHKSQNHISVSKNSKVFFIKLLDRTFSINVSLKKWTIDELNIFKDEIIRQFKEKQINNIGTLDFELISKLLIN